MKTILLSLTAIGCALTACESKAGTGALVGTGIGAGAGALISPTPAGVLIGAGVGAVSGAAIGSALDSNDQEKVKKSSPRTAKKIDNGEQLSVDDVKKMSQAGITDDKIIGTIQSTGSVYHLSTSDVQDLKNSGVSKRVIDFMMQTAYQ
jgi:hypothetical protein